MGWPSQFEKLWPIDAQGNYVVINDDRLVVMTQIPPSTPDGDPQTVVLFDGFAQIPQVDVSAQQSGGHVRRDRASRSGSGTRRSRAGSNGTPRRPTTRPATTTAASRLPCRFNPSDTSIGSQGGYVGNCVATADYTEVEGSDDTYPVFLDPLVRRARRRIDTSFWYVSDAMTYLIANEPSPKDDGGNPFVLYPTLELAQGPAIVLLAAGRQAAQLRRRRKRPISRSATMTPATRPSPT